MHNLKPHRILYSTATVLGLALAGLTLSCSQVKGPAAKLAGTWELRTLNGEQQPSAPQILELRVEGAKLTGALRRNQAGKTKEWPLEEATLKGNEIIFAIHSYAVSYVDNVLQPTDTNKVTQSRFRGQIEGGTIKGKVERISWTGYSRTLDWEAKRVGRAAD